MRNGRSDLTEHRGSDGEMTGLAGEHSSLRQALCCAAKLRTKPFKSRRILARFVSRRASPKRERQFTQIGVASGFSSRLASSGFLRVWPDRDHFADGSATSSCDVKATRRVLGDTTMAATIYSDNAPPLAQPAQE